MSVLTSKVPIGQKIAFGFGMFANQMFPAILGIFKFLRLDVVISLSFS
jgi:GPH family glycoside/pentoside/hexuronide:cation symporter